MYCNRVSVGESRIILEAKRESATANFQLFVAFNTRHLGSMKIVCIPIFLCHSIFILTA
jgi:hypothetical protein